MMRPMLRCHLSSWKIGMIICCQEILHINRHIYEVNLVFSSITRFRQLIDYRLDKWDLESDTNDISIPEGE